MKKEIPKSSPTLVLKFFPLSFGVLERVTMKATPMSNGSKFSDKVSLKMWKQAPAAAARCDIQRHVYTFIKCSRIGHSLKSREKKLPDHQEFI